MTQIGNHIKMTLPLSLRARAQAFYQDILGSRPLESPLPTLDLYELAGGFVVGLSYVPDHQAIPEADYLKTTWLELKVADPDGLTARLRAFGVTEVAYPDPSRFFFQAPGGQVFRVAPMDGGL